MQTIAILSTTLKMNTLAFISIALNSACLGILNTQYRLQNVTNKSLARFQSTVLSAKNPELCSIACRSSNSSQLFRYDEASKKCHVFKPAGRWLEFLKPWISFGFQEVYTHSDYWAAGELFVRITKTQSFSVMARHYCHTWQVTDSWRSFPDM